MALVATAAFLGVVSPAAGQQPDEEYGTPGPTYEGAISSPSGSKPQSKVWFEDGLWWATLYSSEAHQFRIFRLDRFSGQWIDTGVAVDDRNSSRADALSFEGRLYVVSGARDSGVRLYRYTYDPEQVGYTLDADFPVAVGDVGEEPVIARAGDGSMWVTWTLDGTVVVTHSDPEAATWAPTMVVPTADTDAAIASVVAFGAEHVGVMWASPSKGGYFFSSHRPGEPPEVWTAPESAPQGPGLYDDHINLASAPDGRVVAAVKTEGLGGPEVDLIILLVRSTEGHWARHRVSSRRESHTRPIVLLDDERGLVHVVMTGPRPPDTSGQRAATSSSRVPPSMSRRSTLDTGGH